MTLTQPRGTPIPLTRFEPVDFPTWYGPLKLLGYAEEAGGPCHLAALCGTLPPDRPGWSEFTPSA